MNESSARAGGRIAERRARVPPLRVSEALPISLAVPALLEAFKSHPVVVVAGETGSGKTTQLPRILLEAGLGDRGWIGHTQPRRLAARSVAKRLAEEWGPGGDQAVGWKVRFRDRVPPDALIKVMTDGILLREAQRDPLLRRYDAIVLDEAHERSVTIDLLLGILWRVTAARPHFRAVLASATLEPARLAAHFGDAPLIEVPGRMFPVEMRYRPRLVAGLDGGEPRELDLELAVAAALRELEAAGAGDVLVFLPTARDIHEVAQHLDDAANARWEVLRLHARLPEDQQDRIFRPASRRRVILATNVAETSLTVPGVRFVVDAGTARLARYNSRLRIQRLPIVPISQASATQRAGRCGRLGPGICIRLYDEADLAAREAYTPPEILRTNLASAILHMKAAGLGPIEDFPFLDPPRASAVQEGYDTLYELEAVDATGSLLELGRELAHLPLDPRLGRLLIEATRRGCLLAGAIVVAGLAVPDPRLRPVDRADDADRAHARFQDPRSDFLGMIALWQWMWREEAALSRNGFRRLAEAHHLRYQHLREWQDVFRQLAERRPELLAEPPTNVDAEALHRAVLAAYPTHAMLHDRDGNYLGTHGSVLRVWPGSVLAQRRPRWIVAAERLETNRLYARMVAPVERRWIEEAAHHLVRRSWRDPHFNDERARVDVFERIVLQGLVVEPRRCVPYGPVDARHAREIFLRQGLVYGRYRTRSAWYRHNEGLLEEAATWEAKLRRKDLVPDPEERLAFFDALVAADVVDGRSFERWRQAAEREDPRVLHLERAGLLDDVLDPATRAAHPDALWLGGQMVPLQYVYVPGEPADGISLAVPWRLLAHASETLLGWLVPGWLPRLVEAYLRMLPKDDRRRLLPLEETAAEVAASLPSGQGSLERALAGALATRGVRGTLPRFDPRRLPDWFRMRICVVDDGGTTVVVGRDRSEVEAQVRALKGDAWLHAAGAPTVGRAATSWTFGALADSVSVEHGGFAFVARQALADRGRDVVLCHAEDEQQALHMHRGGVRRLLALAEGESLGRHLDRQALRARLERLHESRGSWRMLRREAIDCAVGRAAQLDGPLPWDETAYERVLARVRARGLATLEREVLPVLEAILERYDGIAKKLMLAPPPAWRAAIDDMIAQLAWLVRDGFLARTPWQQLERLPRFLDAIDARLVDLGHGQLARDVTRTARLRPHLERLEALRARPGPLGAEDPEIDALHWLVEEWRVLLFAPALGSPIRGVEAALEARWADWGLRPSPPESSG